MTDPGPSVYSSAEVVKLAGVTYRQLDYWCREGHVSEAQKTTLGSGRQRVFSWREYVRIRRIASLVHMGVRVSSALTVVSLFEEFEQRTFQFDGGVTLTLESTF